MTFDADIHQWKTVAEFAEHLQTVPRPSWCSGLTNHNTYVPNETQWRGAASMQSMMTVYIDKGWSAGPHLYLAAHATNPADTGIWQLTPLAHVGVHAGACNANHLGVESVGDFDARPPTAAQYTLLLAVSRLIMQQWGIPAESVNVHNECMPGRTCPGRYLTGAQIRADLSRVVRTYRTKGLPVYQQQSGAGPLWGHLQSGEQVEIDKTYGNGMAHLADGRGFVCLDGLEAI